MIQSSAHEVQVTQKTLPAALKMPVLNRTTTQKRKKIKNPQTKMNGPLWKFEVFRIALEALNQTTKFMFSVFSDHFIHSPIASYYF